ncbi:MAG: ATP phosphoribosyltransferase [Acidimicrobiia bacterium]
MTSDFAGDDRLRLALPNKGRMEGPTAALLRDAGLIYEKTEKSLAVPVRNVPIELLFVRTEDVAELVADGVAEMGITGLDLLAEAGSALEVVCELGYARCRLMTAVPITSPVQDISELKALRVATAHPQVVGAFFAEKGIDVVTVPLHGSVEVAPKLGVADAVVDLVSTGSTMRINGLRPIATLMESQAVLVSRGEADARLGDRMQQVTTMFTAVIAARGKRYVLMNVPTESIAAIEALIPGLDSPSVVPLAQQGMVAIHSVVEGEDVWRVVPDLRAAGASGILVLPIEKLIP